MITAGPTREYLDPVRFLSNPSSGKMGYALAEEAQKQGAKVMLISGPVGAYCHTPPPMRVIPVTSAQQMYRAVMQHAKQTDILIMAAAVSDYRPEKTSPHKVKKRPGPMTIRLVRTPDILAALGKMKRARAQHPPEADQPPAEAAPLLVGFAAETQNLIKNARDKLLKKNCDLVVANQVGKNHQGFASDQNQVFLLDRDKNITRSPLTSKRLIARFILRHIKKLLSKR